LTITRLAWRARHASIAASRWMANEASSALGRGARRPHPQAPTALLLAWFFPPVVSGGTYRPLSLVRYGARLGWQFAVLGSSRPTSAAGEHLLQRVPANVKVARIDRNDGGFFFDVDHGFLTALDVVEGSRKLLGPIRPHVVLATGPPFALFVAGDYLARRYRVPLVLDYRDEWTECPFEFVRKSKADRWWETRTLSNARLVIFTTESQRDNCLSAFPALDPQKCLVLPNGWDPEDSPGEFSRRESRGPALAFVGNLGDHTPPDDFLETLSNVLDHNQELATRLRIGFVGQKSASTRRRLERFKHQHVLVSQDQVAKDEATRVMRSAGALLVLNDPRLQRYIPGKIYEYLAARRPLFVFGLGGEIERLVRRLNAGVVVPAGDAESLGRALSKLVELRPADLANRDLDSWLARHSRSQLAAELFNVLSQLISQEHADAALRSTPHSR